MNIELPDVDSNNKKVSLKHVSGLGLKQALKDDEEVPQHRCAIEN